MFCGTTRVMNSSSDSQALQHLKSYPGASGPMWRAMKLAPGSSSAKVGREAMILSVHQLVVGGSSHQIIELGGVGEHRPS
ncbi:MAG: hypothetical protein U1E16_04705 [Hyphomicrobiales bacterium]